MSGLEAQVSGPPRGRRIQWLAAVVVLLVSGMSPARGYALPIDFEAVEDLFGTGTVVDTQYAADGLLFSNALALTSGLSLNEIEYPPRSGTTVVRDTGGGLRIDFTSTFYGVEGYFTYAVPVTLQAFDGSGGLLASVTSTFGSNLALGGDPGASPNERLALASAAAIAFLVITADAFGEGFVMDDFNAFATPSVPAPEPSMFALSAIGLAGAWRACRRRTNGRA